MKAPHDSWADVYELACAEEFGPLYHDMTALTLRAIHDLLPPGGSVVDFGAGTGRLSTPLARAGYAVASVEPSAAMLRQLQDPAEGPRVERHCCRMQDFSSPPRFDLALCVFTVVSYLLDDDALRTAFARASQSLRRRGQMLIDIPAHRLFSSRRATTGRMVRRVHVTPQPGAATFLYREELDINSAGQWVHYSDEFQIRCWEEQAVLAAAAGEGLEPVGNLSAEFSFTGSTWWILQKTA